MKEFFKSTKNIVMVAILAVLILAVAASSFFVRTSATNCPDCLDGMEACGDCDGVGCIECGLLGKVACDRCEGDAMLEGDSIYYSTALSLAAPVIAIVLALITKEVYSSLFIGIVIGGLLNANYNIPKALDAITGDGLITAVADTAGIFIFLVILGVLVVLVNKAGGSQAFGRWAQKNVKTKAGALLATFALGVLIFIDDYFNCLTVGAVMRPVTDSHKISRSKLAYIIDATAAPVCMIAPISSWAAAVSEYAPEGTSGLVMFIKAIPFNFYSILTLVFVVAIAIMGFDYGKMSGIEFKAMNGDAGAIESKEEENEVYEKGRVIDLILPIAVLMVSCVIALVYVGGFFGETVWYNSADLGDDYVDYTGNFIGAFGNTDATVALPWGSAIALVFTIIYLMCRKAINFKEAMAAIPKGFTAMVPAILILTFATALKNMTGLLGSDIFVENLLAKSGNLAIFLPAIIFVVACFISFSTGTSWGTFGILIPIVLAVFEPGTILGTIGMSACLAGAVCGDHCSPISDTTIMASAGAQCNHVDHVQTQLPYTITVAAISFVAFILSGVLTLIADWVAYIVIPVAIAATVGTLFVIKIITKKKAKKESVESK